MDAEYKLNTKMSDQYERKLTSHIDTTNENQVAKHMQRKIK